MLASEEANERDGGKGKREGLDIVACFRLLLENAKTYAKTRKRENWRDKRTVAGEKEGLGPVQMPNFSGAELDSYLARLKW